MVEGRRRQEWSQTSLLVAAVINSNKLGGQPVSDTDFFPFEHQPTMTLGEFVEGVARGR